MKDLIIKALNEVFEAVTKQTPNVKINEEFFDAEDCSVADLQKIIKENNLPKDIRLELWYPQSDNKMYKDWPIDGDGYSINSLGFVKRTRIPTTEKEQLKYRTKEMRIKGWDTVKYTLLNNGYTHSDYYLDYKNVFYGSPTNKIDAYDLYINKKWDELVEYYSKYYRKRKQ